MEDPHTVRRIPVCDITQISGLLCNGSSIIALTALAASSYRQRPNSLSPSTEHAIPSAKLPVIVLTPVRNESWILRRFLSVTSHFADHIVVAYQDSSDDTLEICREYPLVTVIDNPSKKFNEADRQRLLIDEARKLVSGPKVLLALDADEILASTAFQSQGWQRMLEAAPGTVVYFDFVDLYKGTEWCIRYADLAPLAYVDDGAQHVPLLIHSHRIPTPASANRIDLADIQVMHYALTRLDAMAAKLRFYSVMENLLQTRHLLGRRYGYRAGYDWTAPENLEEQRGSLQRAPEEWFAGWDAMRIDMRTIPMETYYWHDFAVLDQFRSFGPMRFWLDDIWEFDWQALVAARDVDAERPSKVVACPPAPLRAAMRMLDFAYSKYTRARRRLAAASQRLSQ